MTKYVRSTVRINQGKIKRLSSATTAALVNTVDQLRTDVREKHVVPFEGGDLQNFFMHIDTSQAAEGHAVLLHGGPYARRLFYHPEYNFNTKENKNARGMWLEDWLPGGRYEKYVQHVYVEMLKRFGGV